MKVKILAAVLCAVIAVLTAILYVGRPASAYELESALNSTHIERLSCREMPLGEAVAIVIGKVRQNHPSLRPFSVVSHHEPPFEGDTGDPFVDQHVTLELKDLPANKALYYCTSVASVRYLVRDGTIHIFAGHLGPTSFSERAEDWWQLHLQRLRTFYN